MINLLQAPALNTIKTLILLDVINVDREISVWQNVWQIIVRIFLLRTNKHKELRTYYFRLQNKNDSEPYFSA